MGKTCIYEAKNEKDFENKLKSSPYTVGLLKATGCGHCANVEAIEEKACRSLGSDSPVTFVKCDVKANKGCRAIWEALRPKDVPIDKYGVPVTVGLTPNNSYNNPLWRIIGEQPEELESVMNDIAHRVSAWRQGKKQGAAAQTSASPEQEAPSRREYSSYQRMAPMYGKIAYESSAPPMKRFYQMRTNPNYIGVDNELCLPPRCDRETSRKSIIRFIL